MTREIMLSAEGKMTDIHSVKVEIRAVPAVEGEPVLFTKGEAVRYTPTWSTEQGFSIGRIEAYAASIFQEGTYRLEQRTTYTSDWEKR